MSDKPVTTPEEMTVAELQHAIGKLQAILFRKVAGDQTEGMTITPSSGCVFHDLNIPCQKQPDCEVCDAKA